MPALRSRIAHRPRRWSSRWSSPLNHRHLRKERKIGGLGVRESGPRGRRPHRLIRDRRRSFARISRRPIEPSRAFSATGYSVNCRVLESPTSSRSAVAACCHIQIPSSPVPSSPVPSSPVPSSPSHHPLSHHSAAHHSSPHRPRARAATPVPGDRGLFYCCAVTQAVIPPMNTTRTAAVPRAILRMRSTAWWFGCCSRKAAFQPM